MLKIIDSGGRRQNIAEHKINFPLGVFISIPFKRSETPRTVNGASNRPLTAIRHGKPTGVRTHARTVRRAHFEMLLVPKANVTELETAINFTEIAPSWCVHLGDCIGLARGQRKFNEEKSFSHQRKSFSRVSFYFYNRLERLSGEKPSEFSDCIFA